MSTTSVSFPLCFSRQHQIQMCIESHPLYFQALPLLCPHSPVDIIPWRTSKEVCRHCRWQRWL